MYAFFLQAADSVAEPTDQAVSTLTQMADSFFAALPRIGIGLVVLALFWIAARSVRSLVHRVTPGPRNAPIGIVLGRLAYAGFLVLGTFVAIAVIFPGVTAATLISGLGIGGLAVGFAFQDIFQNLLAGILILLRQPFQTGDEIVSGDYIGTVEAIETRATLLRTYDGRRVIIPNSQIYTEPVTVITAYNMVRSQYDVGIGYGDDIETAKRIALEAVHNLDGVLEDPAPDVLTWDLAGSSVNLRVRWWSSPIRTDVTALRDAVLQAVSDALSRAGVDLPFPTQVTLWHDQTDETDGDRARQREGWPVSGTPPKSRTIAEALSARRGPQTH